MHRFSYKLVLSLVGCARWLVSARGDTLEEVEPRDLGRYLASLQSGQPGSAGQVDKLADVSFAGLRQTMQAYVDLPAPIEPHTHRSFQALLERMSRTTLMPWPMLNLYSPDLARFMIQPDDPLAQKMFQRLLTSGDARRGLDLAVRLTPQQTLLHLKSGVPEQRVELLEAWNRRLGRGHETRPLPQLHQHVAMLAKACRPQLPRAELAALLQFVAYWSHETVRYEECLVQCLQSDDPQIVLAALAVQQRVPKALAFNAALIKRLAHEPRIVEEAIRNYASDDIPARLRGDIGRDLEPFDSRPGQGPLQLSVRHGRAFAGKRQYCPGGCVGKCLRIRRCRSAGVESRRSEECTAGH